MMKYFRIWIIISIYYFNTACTVNRYYYVAKESTDFYEFQSFSGDPAITVAEGDTLTVTGINSRILGGKIPVEVKGYGFYAPYPRADFLYIKKIKKKDATVLPGIVYGTRLKQKQKEEEAKRLVTEEKNYFNEQEKLEWYGQVNYSTPILREPVSIGKEIGRIPANSITKIKRHNYNYWEVLIDGKVGYIPAYSVYYFSKTASPFIKTAYTGRTYHPNGESYTSPRTNTPTTGATIHTGPRGGRYYINSHGNKTYIKRK